MGVVPSQHTHPELFVVLQVNVRSLSKYHVGCGDLVMTQSSQKGQCLPVVMGNPGSQSLTFAATTVSARHVGLGPGFVDKDQTGEIYVGLIALARDVRPVLIAGQHAFLKLIPSNWKKRESMPVSA